MKLSEKIHAIPVRTDTVAEEDILYRYTLSLCQDMHAPYQCPTYLIQAEQIDADGSTLREATEVLVDPGYALIFYEICREHRVSPVHLHDIAEDFAR